MKTVQTPINQPALDAFVAEKAETLQELVKQAIALAQGRAPFIDKAEGLMTLAQSISDTITPYTPCGGGCNHCCYMAVAVTSFEAEMIGRYLGRPLATQGKTFIEYADREDLVKQYTGVPCSLLGKDGKCTVYPVRPIPCRLHHNMAATSENCKINKELPEGGLPTTPTINLQDMEMAIAGLMVKQGLSFADVRDFFPPITDNEGTSK